MKPARRFMALRCRCGFSAGGFGHQPKRCPKCSRDLKRVNHRIPDFVRVGAQVDYCSVIGEEPTLRGCFITSDVFLLGETPCVMIDRRRGAVAVEALREAQI
jgi:hypothetical protein